MEARGRCCYQNWMAQHRSSMEELSQALARDARDPDKLRHVVDKRVEQYKDYTVQRFRLSKEDAPSLFCPIWCTSYENSFMWLAGCRPSLCIRLAYTLSGSQLQDQLEEFLNGVRRGNLAELSPEQLNMVDELHRRTVREEEKLTDRMATLQEDVVEEPLVSIAGADRGGSAPSLDEVDSTMNAHASALGKLLEEADKLRLSTLTRLMEIFTPRQAVDFLIAAMQLHISINEWGKRRDSRRGRTTESN